MKDQYPISDLCDLLDVSRSGYYDWAARQAEPCQRDQEDKRLRAKITALHKQSRQTYGSPRIHKQLAKEGCNHGRNRIAKLMRQEGIFGRQQKRYRVLTTDSKHDLPIAPNRLAEAAPPTAPDQQWVGDITYIQTDEGWLYLAAVMDLYSRKIVGWAMSPRIDTELVLNAWNMAMTHRSHPQNLVFHSDRGVQYASHDFRDKLNHCAAIPSMSRKANCYDNAAMESFWSTLKLELIYRLELKTQQQARREIFSFIEAFYNPKRLHSSLGFMSPAEYENKLELNPKQSEPRTVREKDQQIFPFV